MTLAAVNKRRAGGQDESLTLQIKFALLSRGVTIAGLARKLGLSRTAVSQAINHGIYAPTLAAILRELAL